MAVTEKTGYKDVEGEGSFHIQLRARREGFPDDLQLLCFNCNCGKAIHGECPHERERQLQEA